MPLATKLFDSLTSSRKINADLTLEDRRSLSDDEERFRQVYMGRLSLVETDLADCNKKHTEALVKIALLEARIAILEGA